MQHVALQRQHVTYNAHCRTLCRRGDGLQSRLGPNNIPRSTWQADAALHSLQVRETRLSWNESKGVTYARQPNHAVRDTMLLQVTEGRCDGATVLCRYLTQSLLHAEEFWLQVCEYSEFHHCQWSTRSRLSWLHAEPQWATALPRPLSCNVRRTLSFGAGLR
jgi:hypothetical protein